MGRHNSLIGIREKKQGFWSNENLFNLAGNFRVTMGIIKINLK